VALGSGEHRRDPYLALNKFGQVPCLEDLQNGRRLAQSAAILEYLADRTGRFGGATYDERLSVREWLYWDFDHLSPVIFRLWQIRIGFYKAPEAIDLDLQQRAAAALGFLERHLAGRDFIVGEGPTIADINVYGALSRATDAGIALAAFPGVTGYMGRIEELPGFAPRTELLPRESRPA
jgi:glutathione S-transferase